MNILTKSTQSSSAQWLADATTEGAALLIDKETTWTSFDAVAKVRNILRNVAPIKKVGHAGTLDPLATGLLIICCGKATKSINEFQALPKEYTATFKLGATTQTDDAEGKEENLCDVSHLRNEEIRRCLGGFVGNIEQIPPMYSALKIGGKKLYELARQHKEVERQPRSITIYDIADVEIALPFVHVRVRCSKGTYIRTLAKDVGAALGVGAYLHSLRRTMIGDYHVNDALRVADFRQQIGLRHTTMPTTPVEIPQAQD